MKELLHSAEMSDTSLLAVLQPSSADVASRQELVTTTTSDIPPVEEWRYDVRVGARLGGGRNNIVLRSNHFRVPTERIPDKIFHYHLRVQRVDTRTGEVQPENIPDPNEAGQRKAFRDNEVRLHTTLLWLFMESNADLFFNMEQCYDFTVEDSRKISLLMRKMGIIFDGKSSVFTSDIIAYSGACLTSRVAAGVQLFEVTLTLAEVISAEAAKAAGWRNADQTLLRALDCALFNFARWQVVDKATLPAIDISGKPALSFLANHRELLPNGTEPHWVMTQSAIFENDPSAPPIQLQRGIVALQGYYAALKTSCSGLLLVSDLAVTAFLKSGDLISVMSNALEMRREGFIEMCRAGKCSSDTISALTAALAGTKIKATHMNMWAIKIRSFGPPANSRGSIFTFDGAEMTVEEYFKRKYGLALRFPFLPTINVKSSSKPVLLPAELLIVPPGQTRTKPTPELVGELIKYAAVPPDFRQNFIQRSSFRDKMSGDESTYLFGINESESAPMAPEGFLLPPPKLQYNGTVVDPGLKGDWYSKRFLNAPPGSSRSDPIRFAVVVINSRDSGRGSKEIDRVVDFLKSEAADKGVSLEKVGLVTCSERDAESHFSSFKSRYSVGFILVILADEKSYSAVKFSADKMGLITQCLTLEKVIRFGSKDPKGYTNNVLLKLNMKLGGRNHSIAPPSGAARAPSADGVSFQDQPGALPWVFDRPCMLMGVDVSHPGENNQVIAST